MPTGINARSIAFHSGRSPVTRRCSPASATATAAPRSLPNVATARVASVAASGSHRPYGSAPSCPATTCRWRLPSACRLAPPVHGASTSQSARGTVTARGTPAVTGPSRRPPSPYRTYWIHVVNLAVPCVARNSCSGANGVLGPTTDLVLVPSAGRNVESLSGEDAHLPVGAVCATYDSKAWGQCAWRRATRRASTPQAPGPRQARR